MRTRKHWCRTINNYLLPLLLVLLFLPLPLFWKSPNHKESEAACVILLTVSFWITKCIPVEVTSFIPVVLVPLLGIADSDVIASAYLEEAILFYLGICLFSLAIECSNLHMRIALNILYCQSKGISSLLFGTMFTTAFMSTLVDNALCASMMTPIIVAILDDLESGAILNPTGQHFPKSVVTLFAAKDTLKETESNFVGTLSGAPSLFPSLLRKLTFEEVRSQSTEGKVIHEIDSHPKYPSAVSTSTSASAYSQNCGSSSAKDIIAQGDQNIPTTYGTRALFLIAAAYAANIGGTVFLISSGTNIAALHVVARARSNIEENPSRVESSVDCLHALKFNMFTWFEFNAIAACLNFVLGFVFFVMLLIYLGRQKGIRSHVKMVDVNVTRDMFKKKLETLGPMTFQQYALCILFVIWILLLLFENPHNFPGWAEPYCPDWIGGSTSTFLVVLLLFTLPRKAQYFREVPSGLCSTGIETLLTWEYVQMKLPWKTLLLLGGGSAILMASSTSGLRALLIEEIRKSGIGNVHPVVIFILITCSVTVATSVVSNTAACFLIAPVSVEMAFAAGAHPLYFVLPASTICSYAFLFTVSSPPNAIFASINSVKQIDVFKSGCCLLLISLTTLIVITHTLGDLLFGFSNYKGYCNPR
ncbi:unnamed protein product [Allacma fusca]|uniref:Uncharacterized protein n=1 Tax=Allacma fusca TaxID=39272 RepID=A0A8J2PAM5_9HEXA|nr:unnamed protein product [Allacma fusca]